MRLLAAVLLVALAVSSSAQGWDGDDRQPYTRTSPDEKWVLAVDPSRRDGGGGATCRLERDKVVVWSGFKPWTFWDSVVTDEGFVAGYSYSEDGVRDLADGDFHVVILGPDGSVKRDEVHERTSGQAPHTPSNPLARGLFEQPDAKRVVFRIADADINRQHEEWWCYQLPDASEVYRKRPADVAKDVGDTIVGAVAIPGTPLVAVQWRTFDWPRIAFRCLVLDAGLNPVWTSAFLDEFDGRVRGKMDEGLRAIYRDGSLTGGPGVGRFAYRSTKDPRSIDYQAEHTGHGWIVRELQREDMVAPQPPKPKRRFADLPLAKLESRGEIALAAPLPVDAAVRDIAAIAWSAKGEIRLVREEREGAWTLLRLDAHGRELHARRLELADALPLVRPMWWPLGPDAWLATQSPYDAKDSAQAWSVDASSGSVKKLESFACPSIREVAALGGGRFVVLDAQSALSAYDADGRQLWRIGADSEPEHPGALFSPDGICVTTDGVVVVVDNIRHTLQQYDASGKHLRTIDLDAAWKREANYPTSVTADVDGGVLVHDFDGTPPLVRMLEDGSVRAEITPRLTDGGVIEELTDNARVAPDGTLWAYERQRLMRLDARGFVDLVVGASRDPDVLAQPSAAAVDVLGRVLIHDDSTDAIHVFDGRGGQRLFVCRPRAGELDGMNSIASITATRDRGVRIGGGSNPVQYGPDGASRGRLVLPEGLHAPVDSPLPDVVFASRSEGGFARLDGTLAQVAEFVRAPDGTWIRGSEPVVGPDGAVAVLNSTSGSLHLFEESVLLYEAADPARGRSIALPEETPSHCLAVGRRWLAISGYGDEVLLVRRAAVWTLRFRVPGGDPDAKKDQRSFRFGFDPEREELIAVDITGRRVHRFALP